MEGARLWPGWMQLIGLGEAPEHMTYDPGIGRTNSYIDDSNYTILRINTDKGVNARRMSGS